MSDHRPPLWERVGDSYNLKAIDVDSIDVTYLETLLQNVEKDNPEFKLRFSTDASDYFRRWFSNPKRSLKEGAYCLLSNWFLTSSPAGKSSRARHARKLWDALFCHVPEQRLTDWQVSNRKVIPQVFEKWWSAQLKAQSSLAAVQPVGPRHAVGVVARIDKISLANQFADFKRFVERKSKVPFQSFGDNPYVQDQEGYKAKLYDEARGVMAFNKWKKSDVGSGKIAKVVVDAIELSDNNLVNRAYPPYSVLKGTGVIPEHELALYDLYCGDADKNAFDSLTDVFGRKYALLAYLFFLKDKSKYMPIAPQTFDLAFEKLDIDFRTSRQCSWDNYTQYNRLLGQIRRFLSGHLQEELSLLDAHSFVWILASQMEKEEEGGEVPRYHDFGEAPDDDPAELQTFAARVRRGQYKFRHALRGLYGDECAVTGYGPPAVLEATHIWPHSESGINKSENGLLLRADIHTLFDADLLRVDPDSLRVVLDPSLADTEYWTLNGQTLRERHDGSRPSRKYLQRRWTRQLEDDDKAE